MRVSTLIRNGAVGLAAVALAACSDTPVMPHQARTTTFEQAPAFSRGKGPATPPGPQAKALADPHSQLDSTTFTLTSAGGMFKLGLHVLYVPSGALCDASSPYGSQYFNDAASCVQPAAPVQVQAVWSTRHGHAYVEFEPALRFNPAPDAPAAILALHDKESVAHGAFQILWRNEDGQWVDESVNDPTLKAFTFGRDVLARRIKHFSGYNVSASLSEDLLY